MVLFASLTTSKPRMAEVPFLRTLLALNAEYRRALAAEEHYTSLRQSMPRADIPRRVFDTFYKRDFRLRNPR